MGWLKQVMCRHWYVRTTVTAYYGPCLEIEAVCMNCGKHVRPSINFSYHWRMQKIQEAMGLKRGESEVVFDTDPE